MSTENYVEEKPKKLKEIRKEAEERTCPVQQMQYFIDEFLAKPMCGKCYPCALGAGEAQIRVAGLASRGAEVDGRDLDLLKRIGENMIRGSLCKRGKDTGEFILEHLENSRDEIMEHVARSCPSRECKSLVRYEIMPELCTMCGECKKVCRYNAVLGETRKPYFTGYQPFEIRQKRCTGCGECVDVCPEGAIVFKSSLRKEANSQDTGGLNG